MFLKFCESATSSCELHCCSVWRQSGAKGKRGEEKNRELRFHWVSAPAGRHDACVVSLIDTFFFLLVAFQFSFFYHHCCAGLQKLLTLLCGVLASKWRFCAFPPLEGTDSIVSFTHSSLYVLCCWVFYPTETKQLVLNCKFQWRIKLLEIWTVCVPCKHKSLVIQSCATSEMELSAIWISRFSSIFKSHLPSQGCTCTRTINIEARKHKSINTWVLSGPAYPLFV